MQPDKIFEIVKLNKFMTRYSPTVKQWRNKNAGFDGRKPISYTPQDLKEIKAGVRVLIKELKKVSK